MDIALDAEGDLDISEGDLRLVTGVDAVAQHVRLRLNFFLGEWFLNTREGIPYFRDILIKNASVAVVSATIKEVIQETPQVESIDVFEIDINSTTRVCTINCEATTNSGETLVFEDFILKGF